MSSLQDPAGEVLVELPFTSVLGGAVGAVMTIILLITIIWLLAKLRRNPNEGQPVSIALDKLGPPVAEKVSSRDLNDEKDPDVIPAKFEPVLGNGTIQRIPPAEEPAPWPTQQYSWELRPKELRLEPLAGPVMGPGVAAAPGVPGGKDYELNGTAIKERLMASRLPESCV